MVGAGPPELFPELRHEGAYAAQDFFAFQVAPARVGLTAAG